ncbi:hypothetical protein E4U50_006342 [Claviceps purpurea]|nr:hypothetical protein E4U50_006342 [Claviceps purpurea]
MKECAAQIAHEKSMHELLMKHPHPNIARWITQLASALSWIEGLAFVHGDLRPANILLTANDNIRLADFDVSVKIGEPYAKLNGGLKFPDAGPITEQFALGSYICTIRFGHIPFDELDTPDRIRKLMNNEFPSRENDAEFGDVTLSCWQGQYTSVSAVYDDIKARCDGLGYDTESFSDVSEDLIYDMPSLIAECEDFVSRERGTGNW